MSTCADVESDSFLHAVGLWLRTDADLAEDDVIVVLRQLVEDGRGGLARPAPARREVRHQQITGRRELVVGLDGADVDDARREEPTARGAAAAG